MKPTTLRKLSNEELVQAFEWCEKHGTPDDWTILAMAYYWQGYYLNSVVCFEKADKMNAAVSRREQDTASTVGHGSTAGIDSRIHESIPQIVRQVATSPGVKDGLPR